MHVFLLYRINMLYGTFQKKTKTCYMVELLVLYNFPIRREG